MNHKSPNEDRADFDALLKQYENLKNGHSSAFLEEESFEQIINYFEKPVS
jgi:hypothetical protein